MFSFSVNDKTYKVKFGYGVLTQSDILTQVSSMGAINNPKDMINASRTDSGRTAKKT